MRKILEQCPTCGGGLVVTEVQCARCQTLVRSRYAPCAFCALSADQLTFVKLFIEKRGNLREVEKALGVSYPTVRSKLEEIAERLAGAPIVPETSPDAEAEARREVLRLISEGKLSVREGLSRLRTPQAGDQAGEDELSPES